MEASELTRRLMTRCTRCRHWFGDHAAHQPHPCVTFTDPDCPCQAFGEGPDRPQESVHGRETAGAAHNGEVVGGPCPTCQDSGWAPYPDPVLKDFTLHRCPDC